MIGRCSPDSHLGIFNCHSANVGCSFFGYPNDDLRNHTNQKRKHKTWISEDNQLALCCYIRSNPILIGYWKRMIEIWQECANFQTSQRLAEQFRTIIKKAQFSDVEILEIYQKINIEQNSNTVPDTSRINKQKKSLPNEPPTLENGNATQPQNAQPNHTQQTQTQEPRVNLEILKWIRNGENTILRSRRNIDKKSTKTGQMRRWSKGDNLSLLLFIIAKTPLNHILRKCTAGYKLSRSQEKINHLMYMDDIKLFANNEKELETLIHTVRIYSQNIGMEFGKEKCAVLVRISGKRHLTDGIELPNQDKIRTLGEKETYNYLGILEADTIKQVEMKDKIQKENIRRTRKLHETKLSSRNLIKGINTQVLSLVRYSGSFFYVNQRT